MAHFCIYHWKVEAGCNIRALTCYWSQSKSKLKCTKPSYPSDELWKITWCISRPLGCLSVVVHLNCYDGSLLLIVYVKFCAFILRPNHQQNGVPSYHWHPKKDKRRHQVIVLCLLSSKNIFWLHNLKKRMSVSEWTDSHACNELENARILH